MKRMLGFLIVLVVLVFAANLAFASDDEEPAGRTSEMETTAVATATSAAPAAPISGYQIVPLSPGHVAVVENGAPADWRTLRWADYVLHSNPVRDKGIAPINTHQGFTLNPLGDRDPDGNLIDYYVTWTSGASGETVWIRVHPGESTEMRPTTETSTFALNGEIVSVRLWIGGWFTRCANPTKVVNWQKEANTIVRTVPGPERIVKETVVKPTWYTINTQTKVVQTKGFAFYQSSPQVVGLPEVKYMFFWEEGLKHDIVRAAGQALSASRFTITQNAPVNNRASSGSESSSSAASSSSSSSSASASANQQQQQQQGTTISGGGDSPAN